MQRTRRELFEGFILRANGAILGAVLHVENAIFVENIFERYGPRSNFPSVWLMQRQAHESTTKSRIILAEMCDHFAAGDVLVRVRQTIRALDRRYDFANYRDF